MALEQTYQQRRAVHRNVSQQRSFLKGEPADWFDPYAWRWRAFAQHPNHERLGQRTPKYNHHINLYQYGWQVLQAAIQTTGLPGSLFVAQNPRQQKDREAARLAKPIIDYERSVIDYRGLWGKVFRFFYTDGIALGYGRHVPNERKFGIGEIRREVALPQVTQEEGYKCFNCETMTPPGLTMRDEQGFIHCPDCAEPLHAENFMPEQIEMVPKISRESVIKGEEVVDIFGALESPLPWWCNQLKDCPYIPIEVETPAEQIIKDFPELESEIRNPADTQDREGSHIRLISKTPQRATWQTATDHFRTYGRWWFQPESFFWEKDTGKRAEFVQAYPEGAFVQFANSTVLDAIPERAEDYVGLARALDGDGMYTPSLGQNGVPIQEAANTSFNQQLEAQEFADFPPLLMDIGVLDPKAFENTPAIPGFIKGVVLPPNKTLRESTSQINVKSSGEATNRLIDTAQKWFELLVGASPALAGGQMTNVRAAEQYELAKNQALQRLAPPYEAAKQLMAKIDEILVHEFLANRTDEEFQNIVGEHVDMRQLGIMLAPRQGRVFAKSEQSESIPQTWAQKQSALTRLLTTQNPSVQQAFAESNIIQLLFDSLGVPELKVKSKALYDKVERVIELLLAGHQIQFDALFDDPRIVIQLTTEWAASPGGMEAKTSNPQGFESVRAYVQGAALAMARAVDQTQQAAPGPEQPKGANV